VSRIEEEQGGLHILVNNIWDATKKVYSFTDLDGSQPDLWRYVVEVQDTDKPANGNGYR